MKSKYHLETLNQRWGVAMECGYIVELFSTEESAILALSEFENGNRFVKNKEDIWVIGGQFASAPGLGGTQIDEVANLDMNQFNVVRELTQEKYEQEVKAYYKQHGSYPEE